VAVIGASDRAGSVGRTVLSNLLTGGFRGPVYAVNAKRATVLDQPAYPTIGAIPEPVDLAVIVTPAPTVPDLIRECGARRVPAAIVISAGFKELGPEGEALEQQILQLSQAHGIRIVGPNCLGVMCPGSGLNATFAGAMAQPGNVAFLSQSGALCTGVLDWSLHAHVGFSAFVSLGSMLDVSWADLIDYFGRDPLTSAILLYMESVGNARAFLSAAREVALSKPIIAIKGGRTQEASAAAASHTGSLAGNDAAFDAALRRVGILRVERIAELFAMADVLAKQPRPRGKRLTIVTNAGGPGVLATDALVQGGGKLAPLSELTQQALDALLPRHWSRANPIDVLGDADAERYAQTLQIAAQDPESDGLLVILTPQDMTDPLATAQRLQSLGQTGDKPVLASWMGGASVAEGIRTLNLAGIPTFLYPDAAARAFNYLWQYSANLRNIYETPVPVSDGGTSPDERKESAAALLERVRCAGRTLLTEVESKELLSLYGIPTVPTRLAATAEEAVAVAEEIGFPVVLKLHSYTITHKTDVGGVRLDLHNAAQVAEAYASMQASVAELSGAGHFQGVTVQPMIRTRGYELILGSTLDAQFGPVLLFGAGGQLVEVLRDSEVALPPLNVTLARRLMERTRIYRALLGTRGRPPIDLPQLEQTLVNFSQMLLEQPLIQECDINPLLASPEGMLALDGRFVLQPADRRPEEIPLPAVRPYPVEYIRDVRLELGAAVTLRPIRLEDEPLMIRFHEGLSDESVRRRYFQLMHLSRRTDHERLIRVCYCDYDREIVLVADYHDPERREHRILGVGRLSRRWRESTADFALVVADAWQRRGLGALLLHQLIAVARREQIRRISGQILADNWPMQKLCERVGFRITRSGRESECHAALEL
jgi:acetyltransferase